MTNTVIGRRKAALHQAVTNALYQARENGAINFEELPHFLIETPREASHGDFATNAAMLCAKAARTNPRAIAQLICDNIDLSATGAASCEIAGPGFINFRMEENWLNTCLTEIVAEGDSFGNSDFGAGKKIQVEFVSANPTGELHMGNARGAAIGDSLVNILNMAGFKAKREYYINDAGNQVAKFGASLEARYLQALGQDVEFPEDGYHGQDITRLMQELAAEVGDKYLKVESGLRRELLANYGLEKKVADIRAALENFGVKYDVWFSEQSLHDSGAVQRVIEQLQKDDWLLEEDGALWLDCRRFGEGFKPEVLVRANGIPTYFAADIAYHQDKFARGFETVIDIWGADHHGHVARMKGAMDAIGCCGDNLEVMLMQFVRLIEDGEIVKMSKRTGTYVTLNELVEQVGRDAARFFFIMRSADSLIDFDMDLAKKQSAENPVYYVQYAHARINSVINTAKERCEGDCAADFSLLNAPAEMALIRRLADFPDEVAAAADTREPHRIAAYVQEVAASFHTFYNSCHCLGCEPPLTAARLALCKATATVIRRGLNALGVTAPEKM